MMRKWLSLMAVLPLGLLANVSMQGMFTDHAVFARLPKTPVFGKADVGELVTVEFAGMTQSAKAGEDGKWRVDFDLMNVAEGPFELTVTGKNTVKVKDILVGQVWLCSGQSNMQFTLKQSEGSAELIKTSANPKLRTLRPPCRSERAPIDELKASWRIADPGYIGGFTGVGYIFGRKLQAELNCPVGLIDNSWGGSAVEGWATLDYLVGNKDLEKWCKTTYDTYMAYNDNLKKYLADFAAWRDANGLAAPTATAAPADAKWEDNVRLNYGYNKVGPGVIWYRKKIQVPQYIEKNGGTYGFYQHCTNAVFFMDGKEIARTKPEGEIKGAYVSTRFKPGELKAGEHELSIRYWNLYDGFETIRISYNLPGDVSQITGWQRCIQPIALTKEQIAARPARMKTEADSNKVPNLLYNGLIHPLKPYGINGCIWYQGCTNSGRPWQYPAAIQGMIKEWRRDFEWEFPFYYCQLTNFTAKNSNPNVQGWADIRRGQEGALEMPKTGQAVLIDCGEASDIHSLDKMTPATRLFAIAMAKTYGRNIPYSGPVFKSKAIEGNTIRVSFDFVEGGLVAKELPEKYPIEKKKNRWEKLVRNSPDSQLEGFAVAGADGKFYWANAKIDGDTVVVSSDKVPVPVRVRYAYQSNPTCNLYNKAGFPAVPFDR